MLDGCDGQTGLQPDITGYTPGSHVNADVADASALAIQQQPALRRRKCIADTIAGDVAGENAIARG